MTRFTQVQSTPSDASPSSRRLKISEPVPSPSPSPSPAPAPAPSPVALRPMPYALCPTPYALRPCAPSARRCVLSCSTSCSWHGGRCRRRTPSVSRLPPPQPCAPSHQTPPHPPPQRPLSVQRLLCEVVDWAPKIHAAAVVPPALGIVCRCTRTWVSRERGLPVSKAVSVRIIQRRCNALAARAATRACSLRTAARIHSPPCSDAFSLARMMCAPTHAAREGYSICTTDMHVMVQ